MALSVPLTQLVPLQQPVVHRLESHAAWHWLLTQCAPEPQLTQVPPLLPHWASLCPVVTHVVPLQQPSGHKLGSHAAAHCPLTQCCNPAEHAVHAAPPKPQSLSVSWPFMHSEPTQQASGHNPGSQAATHWWPSQCCVPGPHAAQSAPPVPQ
jgi:hypothetical protein